MEGCDWYDEVVRDIDAWFAYRILEDNERRRFLYEWLETGGKYCKKQKKQGNHPRGAGGVYRRYQGVRV